MADQKYSSKYKQKHWGVPKINITASHGRSPLYDGRAVGDKATAISALASLHHPSPSVSNGRIQASRAGGIVTRSKHAQGTTIEDANASPKREDPRTGERIDQDEMNKSEGQQESLERIQSQVINKRLTTVCSEPGKCQAGGELRLSCLSEMGLNIEVPPSYALVGCKSPILPGIMLVAAVDKRYLPDEETSTTMLGFSGNCIGCGAKGFRYFTEFSQHINLRLATQPKKQKHMKYYVVKDGNGRLRKGNLIPWREGRKRSMPMSGSFVVPVDEDTPNDQSSASIVSGPPIVSQNPQTVATSSNGDGINYQSTSMMTQYGGPPAAKRNRWESGGSDSELTYVGDGENSPASSSQEVSRVELPNKPWLTTACGVCPVLLLCQHSIPNVPCSVHDIIVSDLLVGCFDPPQVSDHNQFGNFTGAYNTGESHSSRGPSSSQARYYQSSLSPLTTQMAILLMIQYLSQFDEDDRIMREEVESLLQDAQLELSAGYQHSHILAQSNLLTHVQLPILANLAAVPSKGRVKIVTSPVSLENAIVRGLKFIMDIIKHNQTKFPKVPMPDYIFLLATSQKKAPEFCVLVSGVNQARYLTEAMIGHPVGARITDNVAKLEQLFRLSSDALEQLVSSYEEAMCHESKLVYVPFNGFARMKVPEDEALKLEPKVTITSFQHYGQKTNTVYSTQNQIAKQLVSQVCSIAENSSSLDINRFVNVDFAIVVPPINTLFNQTVQRLADSAVLADLELEDENRATMFDAGLSYVIKHDDSDDSQEKLSTFLKKVQTQPITLFILIFDQAQFYSRPRGVLDLPFYKEFLEASNVVPLFVTSAPYLFQTNCSFIDPENEVYWTDSRSDSDSSSVTSTPIEDDQYVDDQDSMYFGLKEYCDSIKWTHQFPLFRQDDAFERMALRTTRATEDVNVSVLRCYLLIRHYCAAIMWSAGIKPAEPHCTLKTIQIIREIIESPLRNADGSGSMLAIRIPSGELAMMAYESLKVIRDRLGFQYRFAVIHDNGMGELEIEEYFLKRLRFWKTQRGLLDSNTVENWHPRCYEELLDLPCIILLSGRERTGETFPRSLKYIDIRLIDRGFLYRSSLELEFSAIACYISTGVGPRNAGVEEGAMAEGDDNKDDSSTSSVPTKTSHYSSNYPLPVILVSRSAFKAFQTDFYGYPKHLLLPTTPQTRWIGHGRPHLVTSNPANQSLYYRKWTEPKPSNLVGTQCSSVNSRTVISMRSASGIVISPDIPDVVEEDGMSAVETMTETPRQASVAGSETEDNTGEDSKPNSPCQKQTSDEREPKTVRIAPDTRTSSQRSMPTPQSNASESDNEAGTMATTDDESDNETSGSNKYHPRSILFSGLPQVGKTGAYLHFARLLHRMLIKLQKVDVYDEMPFVQESTRDTKETTLKATQPAHFDFKVISQLSFISELKGHRFTKNSPLMLYSSKKEAQTATVKKTKTSPDSTPPVTSVLLSSWAAHDICHHCDNCKPYRDGIGPTTSLYHIYQLESGESLHFLIPPTHAGKFTFTDDKKLQSLKLPKVLVKGSNGEVVALKNEGELNGKPAIMSPIMIPSTGRHETGLLNLYHALEGENHVQLVFVKHQEMSLYNKMWPNHIIVGLPKECDNEGIGAARFFIKEFASQNFFKERLRQDVSCSSDEDIWPMMLMMDDSCVLWQNLLDGPKVDDAANKEGTSIPFNANCSLLKIMKTVESTPDVTKYGAIGFGHFSSKTHHMTKPSFSNTPLDTAVVLNLLMLKSLQYNRNMYSCEDVNFSLAMHSQGIPSFRFDYMTVARKSIESGGEMTVKLFVNPSDNGSNDNRTVDVNDYRNYVTAPDTEDTHYFSSPARYLLERYLAEGAALKLFKTAADRPDHPVLTVNNYVNLGPKVSVEYVSTHNMKDRKLRTKGIDKNKTRYGGLLLYFSDPEVTKELLQQFQFLDDAQLCLVCQDRNTLRQEVVRLDLEENWRFRLRDELQTANDPDDPSLFILTGTHE